MSFTRLNRRLRFFPLGLLWGLVAGWFHAYQALMLVEPSPYFRGIELEKFVSLLIVVMVVVCPIAALLGSALLKRELAARRWIVNWVITALASSAVGVAILWLILLAWLFLSTPAAVEELVLALLALLLFPTGFGILIGIETAVVALLLAPLSLLARRLILRRISTAEPAGGASQTQP